MLTLPPSIAGTKKALQELFELVRSAKSVLARTRLVTHPIAYPKACKKTMAKKRNTSKHISAVMTTAFRLEAMASPPKGPR
jgi:hypothetical protein